MEFPFRWPINFYNDRKRLTGLIVLHTIDAVIFIVRLGVVSGDLNSEHKGSGGINFSVPILLLELISSLPIIVSNVIYIVMKFVVRNLFEEEEVNWGCCKRKTIWRVAVLTCFQCKCYQDHPQGILLTRVGILLAFFIIRFIAFILGAACASRYGPNICTAYTVLSIFSLIPFFLCTVIIEIFHFYRLWTYHPNPARSAGMRMHRSHIRFMPYQILNDRSTTRWNVRSCHAGQNCNSLSLHHQLMYHPLPVFQQGEHIPDITENQVIIGFYQTSKETAYNIAITGFRRNPQNRSFGRDFYFTTKLDPNNQSEAIICARLNISTIAYVNGPIHFEQYFSEQFSTIYHNPPAGIPKVYIQIPEQIERWIIVIRQEQELPAVPTFDDTANPNDYDSGVYLGCF
ncbi:unnamed protein product [Didymodactylos carnosus]|uniref:Transmembrane protein n=1 Tax=Didymodactylos carnosus TaxID=1234261 RepID=A0A814NT66_9BILA|nr:unnamed protein product [Didymodactylos carnosus]CAF1437740.1 unnamed protein product [Didymodactylos carnosus]CAF3863227.1 unnamed protein product [Didymodactylos carnosus]CAF4234596.1 unnamed protein product [Didymodactylos carnosus]